ncbi:MAG: serine/threonine protein kinase [Firmicutes bacterium]|nr:serine/threonine protein kinase [Bacillota bacterium]
MTFSKHDNLKALLGDRYVLGHAVGRGAFSFVFVCTSKDDERRYAVKVMDLSDIPDNERGFHYDLFLREAQILQQLDHPGIPRFVEFLAENDLMVLIMEFVNGMNLDDYLENRGAPLKETEVLDISYQVCQILEYLHSDKPAGKIIYRDLKPANLMIDKNDKIMLIDFATARIYSPEKIKDTIKLGTPGFAAPEAYGNTQTDERADVFSLGATMFHLLTGEDPERYMFQYPPLRKKKPELSVYVQDIVLDALKPKEDRTANIAVMKERIRNLRDTLAFMKEVSPGSLFFRFMFVLTQLLRTKLSFIPSQDFNNAGIVLFLLCLLTPGIVVFLTVKYPSNTGIFSYPLTIDRKLPAEYQRKKLINILDNKFTNYKLYCDLSQWEDAGNAWNEFFAFMSPFQEVMARKFQLYPQAVEASAEGQNEQLTGTILLNILRDYEIHMQGDYLADPYPEIKREIAVVIGVFGIDRTEGMIRKYANQKAAGSMERKIKVFNLVCKSIEEAGYGETSVNLNRYFQKREHAD